MWEFHVVGLPLSGVGRDKEERWYVNMEAGTSIRRNGLFLTTSSTSYTHTHTHTSYPIVLSSCEHEKKNSFFIMGS